MRSAIIARHIRAICADIGVFQLPDLAQSDHMDDPLEDPLIRIIYENYEPRQDRDLWLARVRPSRNTERLDSQDPVH
jgi:hypothetical protein